MTETPRFPRRNLLAGVAAGVVLLAGIAVGSWELQRATRAQEDRDRIEGLEKDAVVRDSIIDDLTGAVDTSRQQLEAEGVEPVVPPAEEIIEDEEPPEVLLPSDEQLEEVLARWCEENGCMGERGPAPSAAQVAAAFVTYCDARGQCRGPRGPAGEDGESVPGEDGEDGQDGIDGEDGEDAPPPSDEQILAVLTSFCADDRCRGPAGPPGEDSTVPGPVGPAGPPGPTCPDGAAPIRWTVDAARSAITGLDAGTYLVCRTPTQEG